MRVGFGALTTPSLSALITSSDGRSKQNTLRASKDTSPSDVRRPLLSGRYEKDEPDQTKEENQVGILTKPPSRAETRTGERSGQKSFTLRQSRESRDSEVGLATIFQPNWHQMHQKDGGNLYFPDPFDTFSCLLVHPACLNPDKD